MAETAFIKESFAQPGGWKTDPSFGWIPNDYHGHHFNVSAGRRRTTDGPDPTSIKGRILVFGGSTVYCSEVPDALTLSSCLQRILNEQGHGHFKVENLGATTITIKQQVARLKMENIQAGDVVVFYDGVNDVIQSIFYNNPEGTIIDESRKQLEGLSAFQRFIFKVHRRLAAYSAFIAVFLNPVKPVLKTAEIAPSTVRAAARQFQESMVQAADHCRSKGAKFVHFLQPCLPGGTAKTTYEKGLIENGWLTAPGLDRAFQAGYAALRRSGAEAGQGGVLNFDLSGCLDPRTEEVYLDYAHVNHAANQMIAKAIYGHLVEFLIKRPF
jgi:lysophospholipase L1-like esterase